MIRWIKVFVLVFLILTNLALAQTKLFFVTDNAVQREFVKDEKLENMIMIYQSEFVKEGELVFSKELLSAAINKKIPNRNAKGYAVLDWEGAAFEIIKNSGEGNERIFSRQLSEFISCISFAKKLRPNVKWSYYGIPFRDYWALDIVWKKKNHNLIPLLKHLDFLSPSLYVLYTVTETTFEKEFKYISENVKLSLEIGEKLNKEIYPFVWHKNNTKIKDKHFSLVSIEDFHFYIKTILSTNNLGKSVDGIIWWNSEEYDFNTRKTKPVFLRQYFNVGDFNSYQYDLFKNYLAPIRKYFK